MKIGFQVAPNCCGGGGGGIVMLSNVELTRALESLMTNAPEH